MSTTAWCPAAPTAGRMPLILDDANHAVNRCCSSSQLSLHPMSPTLAPTPTRVRRSQTLRHINQRHQPTVDSPHCIMRRGDPSSSLVYHVDRQ